MSLNLCQTGDRQSSDSSSDPFYRSEVEGFELNLTNHALLWWEETWLPVTTLTAVFKSLQKIKKTTSLPFKTISIKCTTSFLSLTVFHMHIVFLITQINLRSGLFVLNVYTVTVPSGVVYIYHCAVLV